VKKWRKCQFTIQQQKKKKEVIEENHRQVNIPTDVNEEEEKALERTGDEQLQDGKKSIT